MIITTEPKASAFPQFPVTGSTQTATEAQTSAPPYEFALGVLVLLEAAEVVGANLAAGTRSTGRPAGVGGQVDLLA